MAIDNGIKGRKEYRPLEKATFLFQTREGARGVIQIESQVTKVFGDMFPVKEFGRDPTVGFQRGVRFRFKYIIDPDEEPK